MLPFPKLESQSCVCVCVCARVSVCVRVCVVLKEFLTTQFLKIYRVGISGGK